MRIGFIVGIGVLLVAVVLLAGTCNSTDEGFPPTTAPAATTPTTTPVAPSTTPPTTAPATTTTEPPSLGTLPPIDDLGAPTIGYTSSVSTVGIDKVFFGMTARTAQLAAGTRFTPITPMGECFLVTPDEAPDGITFWIVGGTIERVDIDTREITTRSGAGIGDSEDRIVDMFGDRIRISPLPDGSGNLLAFVPRDQSDKVFRVMFQSDGDEIVRFWSGRLPWVEELGGCPAHTG